MAPEQLQGGEPDARTDIFALGNVRYRMATGRRPFEGTSDASLIAAILEREPPPISSYQPLTPPSLDRVVKSCLAKSPDDRIQTAHDVGLQLSWISEGISDPSRATVGTAPPRSWRWLVWSAAALALVIATALVVLKMKPGGVVRNVRHLTITLPVAAPVGLSSLEVLAVSPDGKRLVYMSGSKLYLRDLEKPSAEPLAGTEGAEVPFFSPDGRWIAFSTAANVIKKVSVEGGAPVTICPAQRVRGATWGPDDTITFGGPSSPLKRVSASAGTPEVLFKTTKNVRWPVFLPGGKNLLYMMAPDFKGNYEQAEIVVRSLESGQSHTVVRGGVYPRYAAGHLLYFNSGTLFAVPFDLRTLRTAGTPKPILEDVERFPQAGLAFYDVSTDGTIFYLPHDPGIDQEQLLWVDRSGRTAPVTSQRRFYVGAQLSPDGRSILASIADRNRHFDLWIYEIAREAWTRVTSEADNREALWSPDGTRFVFSSNRNGPFNIFLMASDLATPPKQITNGNWALQPAGLPMGSSWRSAIKLPQPDWTSGSFRWIQASR